MRASIFRPRTIECASRGFYHKRMCSSRHRPSSGRLGDDRTLRAINPDLTDVSLCAYGWTGPWADRRGFDSIVQMNAGFAREGMIRADASKPVPLPVQILDHATGYLMAAAVLNALRTRARTERPRSARLSLARTAALLARGGTQALPAESGESKSPAMTDEQTYWGAARRVAFPLALDGRGPAWRLQAAPFRSAPPELPFSM